MGSPVLYELGVCCCFFALLLRVLLGFFSYRVQVEGEQEKEKMKERDSQRARVAECGAERRD